MKNNAFTANVKPGGLTDSTQIRILLCVMIYESEQPPFKKELEQALLRESLVNYFELASSLAELQDNELVYLDSDERYHITQKGQSIVTALQNDVPASVRDCAHRSLKTVQKITQNLQDYQIDVLPCDDGFLLSCSIHDQGSELFSMKVYMPDYDSAQKAKEQFMENGKEIHKLLLSALTGNDRLVQMFLKGANL